MDHQAGGERVCPHCREGDYVFLYDRLRLFIDNPDRYYAHTPLDFRMWKYASKGRNDVQSTSDYRDFKRNYKFVNMNKKIPTWDHVNSMTYILYHYLKGVLVTKQFDGSFLEFVEYYDKYAVQFPVLPGDNQALKEYQAKGIKPEEYAAEVGPIEGHTHEETVEAIREHFIHG